MSLKGGVSTKELRETIKGLDKGNKKAFDKLSKYSEDGTISTDVYNKLIEKYAIKREERKKRNTKALLIGLLLLIICLACIITALAHSGRTDSSGGHRDNNNKSGLGSYHYHCDGYPAHLHTNGVCPYATSQTSNQKSNMESIFESADREMPQHLKEKNNSSKTADDLIREFENDEGIASDFLKNKAYERTKIVDEKLDTYNKGYSEGYKAGYSARDTEVIAERQAKKETLINVIIYSAIGLFVILLIVKCFEKDKKQ